MGAVAGWAGHTPAARPAQAHPAEGRPAGGTALTALTTPLTATASDPLYLHISGIPGESVGRAHLHWISVSSYAAGISASSTAPGRARLSPFTLNLPYSLAVPPLMTAVATGLSLGTVELQAADASTGTELNYLTITLSNTRATAIQESSADGNRPSDTLTLTATRIAVSYTAINGVSSSFCFDFTTSRKC